MKLVVGILIGVLLAAVPAGQPLAPAPVGRRASADRTHSNPASHNRWQGIAMAQAHLKLLLGPIDLGHASPELGAMHLLNPLHPIHPGMDHFVAERAEGGLRGQRREHRRP